MNALVGLLLAALLLSAFARPRWWLALGPAVGAVGLTAYRLAVPRSAPGEEAIALVGIVLLAVALEGGLLVGTLARAGFERARDRPASARTAVHAARGIVLVGLAFLGTAGVVAIGSSLVFAALSVIAVGVVLGRMWRARTRGVRIRPAVAAVRSPARAAGRTRPAASRAERRRARLRRGPARPSPRRRVSS